MFSNDHTTIMSLVVAKCVFDSQNLLAGQNVNNNEWHTVRFSRKASNLKLQVDSAVPVRGMLSMYWAHHRAHLLLFYLYQCIWHVQTFSKVYYKQVSHSPVKLILSVIW